MAELFNILPFLVSMNLPDCYRLLGLRTGAPADDIKASYRRLARLYHPDVNPGDQAAEEKFIQITEAYKYLMEVVPEGLAQSTSTPSATPSPTPSSQPPKVRIHVKRPAERSPSPSPSKSPAPQIRLDPTLSETDRKLKQHSYKQLQHLLKEQRFPRAIALVEGLSQRLPKDREVKQWQAITYQRFGQHLVKQRQLDKARIYLKKALQTDPNNRSLWLEVERVFRQIEQLL
ncbi:J domain-containing protein [Leptolyngbya sp. CCY15150]|uniref:J domain-containing protein n=1 Tax=Leptolyngbya sp. CCY15150 TaxID=2767772 RepID=UPI001EF3081A|nr:J domain-containing protein [Leptolyngbya sp. CCY15150]